jgi:hypothetical protein
MAEMGNCPLAIDPAARKVFLAAWSAARRPRLPKPGAAARPRPPETPERQQFVAGLLRRFLPVGELVRMRTTVYEPWYKQLCQACHHTFRVDDPVLPCPGCRTVYHANPLHDLDCFGVVARRRRCCLRCGHPFPSFTEEGRPRGRGEARTSFVGGLTSTFGVPGMPVRVADARTCGQLCAVCGHTVRLGEVLVDCPCGHGEGAICGAVLHLDLARRLHCWRDWTAGKFGGFCPLRGLERKGGP